MLWLVLGEIGIKGKDPWFKSKTATVLTVLSVLITGVFYFPIIQGIFVGINAFWLPCLVAGIFFFFWSYPRQFATILLAVSLWLLVGPGIAGVWFWGLLKIWKFTGGDLFISFALTLIWTSGPIAIGNQILKKFGLIAICKQIWQRRVLTK